MEELFEFEGQEYTLAEVQKAAEAKSLNIDDYIKKYNISRKPGKTTPTSLGADVEETAAPTSLGLKSVDSLPEYPGAKLDFISSISDPEIDTYDVIKNRYFIGTADPIRGAQAVEQEKENKKQIEQLKKNFDKGKFKLSEKKIYEKYKQTGKIDESLVPKAYVRPINPDTLEQYTGVEMLSNVAENFLPGMEAQIQSIGAYALDWVDKALGADAADFFAGRFDNQEKNS